MMRFEQHHCFLLLSKVNFTLINTYKMKKFLNGIQAAIIIVCIAISISPLLNAQSFTPNNNQVCFYENENYGGSYICISSSGEYADLGRYFVGTSSKNWHDKISSVIIGKNACAIMYEHANGGGYCLILRGNGERERRIPKLSPYNFNDKASHIKSLTYPDNLPPEPGSDHVMFFEHTNFDGYSMMWPIDLDITDLTRQLMEDPITGNYSTFTWNDRISSLKLGANTCVTGWTNINYGGQKWMYRANGSNTWNIADLGPLGSGDKWSSFKIRNRDSCIP